MVVFLLRIYPFLFLTCISFFGKTSGVYVLAGIFLLPALLVLVIYFFFERKIKQVINKLTEEEVHLISLGMESEKTIYFERPNLFLPEKHIILGNNLDIIKYSDIIWIYHINTNSGVQGGRQLSVLTNDRKTHQIITSSFGHEQEMHLKIMNLISSKNPIVLKGYTPENISIMTEKKK